MWQDSLSTDGPRDHHWVKLGEKLSEEGGVAVEDIGWLYISLRPKF